MDFDDHKNFAIGDIITAPTPADTGTEITLSPGQVADFPAAPFNAILYLPSVLPTSDNAEIVRVTNIVGDDLTIDRAEEGSTAMDVLVGWRIVASITAKVITDIETTINAIDTAYQAADDTLQTNIDAVQDDLDSKSQLSMVRNEVPGGSINGSNTVFTTASAFATGSLRVYKNGIRLKGGGADYTASASGFTMVTAPATSTVLLVDYEVGAAGFSIGTNSVITGETPTGTINGSTTLFTAARAYIGGSLQVWLNGLLQTPTTDYAETSPAAGTFTFTTAPLTGDILRISYQYNLNPSSNADTVDGIHANATATANQLMPLDANAKVNASLLSNPYKFSAYRNAAWTTQNGSSAAVICDTEHFDTNSNYNTSDGKYTAPVSGFYVFSGGVSYLTTAAGAILITSLGVNSTTVETRRLAELVVGSLGNHQQSGSTMLQLNAGDYVCLLNRAAGGAGGATSNTTYFSGFLVSTI